MVGILQYFREVVNLTICKCGREENNWAGNHGEIEE
jgi:hypothetical protein